jgi:hypothetical protein
VRREIVLITFASDSLARTVRRAGVLRIHRTPKHARSSRGKNVNENGVIAVSMSVACVSTLVEKLNNDEVLRQIRYI